MMLANTVHLLLHYDLFTWAVLLSGCFVSYWLLPFVYGLLFASTRRIPGPLLARITRWYEYYLVKKGLSHFEYISLHEKFGSIVRVGPNRYSFTNPADVKVIYELGGKFTKSEYYEPLKDPEPDRQNIFVIRDPNLHKDRRRKIANLYNMSTMVSYEPAVDRMNAICFRKLTQFANQKQTISLPDFMQFYAFDVIGEITFSKSFNMMEQGGDTSGMIKGIHGANTYMAYTGLLPDLHPWIVRLQNLMGGVSGSNVFFNNTLHQIKSHREANAKGVKVGASDSFLSKLLALESEGKVEMPHMTDALGSNIGAGSDTTAISLSAALYHLYRHPDVLAKLREEIDTMAGNGLVSDPVTFQETQSMPYLQAVIKESLRIHPAVGTILPRKVPAGGVTLGGTFFPEGTEVGANAWALHYSQEIFGEDAAVYHPDRWLQPRGTHDSRDSMMFAFGAGSRTCLGKNISLLEINKVLPQIARHFDLDLGTVNSPGTSCAWFVYTKFLVDVKHRARGT